MRRALGVLCLVVPLVAGACSQDAGDSDDRSGAKEPAKGGIARLAIVSDVSAAFDPAKEYYNISWAILTCCLGRTLISYNGLPEDQGGSELRPDVAADLPEASEDAMTWTFTLKQGVRYGPPFEDVEVTSHDFVRALEREANPKASVNGYSFYYSVIEGFDEFSAGEADSISGVEAPDDKTLVIHTTKPAGEVPFLFTMPATTPIPPDGADERMGAAEGHDKDYGRFLVATGPYMFKGSEDLDYSLVADEQAPVAGYVPGRSIELVRNPSWDPATDDLRPAYLDGFQVTIGGDVTDLFNKVDVGEIDQVIDTAAPPQFIQKYSSDPALRERLHVNPSDAIWYVSMNLALPPFDDTHVRRAVNYAVDKAGLRQLAGGPPHGEIAGHVIPDNLEEDLLQGFDPYATPNGAGDVAKAMEEMKLSRYDADQDGLCDHEGCSGVLTVTDERDPAPAQAALLEQNLRVIGITLDVKTFETTTMYSKCNDPVAQVALCPAVGWIKDFADAYTFGPPLFGSEGLSPGCCNYGLLGASAEQLREWGYEVTSVPSIDDQLATCSAASGDQRVQCWADIDRYLMEEIVPWVPREFANWVEISSERVTNWVYDQNNGMVSLARLAVAPDS